MKGNPPPARRKEYIPVQKVMARAIPHLILLTVGKSEEHAHHIHVRT